MNEHNVAGALRNPRFRFSPFPSDSQAVWRNRSRSARATFLLLLLLAGRRTLAADFALIIGVNECPKFEFSDGTRPRPLRGAETDADAMRDLLIDDFSFPADHVRVLKRQVATRENVLAAMDDLRDNAAKGDRVVFHFSGHGTQVPDRKPFDESDNDRLDEALCLYDTDAEGNNLLTDDELGRWLDDLKAHSATVILDCCHAGTGIKGPADGIAARSLPIAVSSRAKGDAEPWRDLKSTAKRPGKQIAAFFACQAGQQAYERRLLENPPRRAGQFSHFFREGLAKNKADKNRDGSISNQEILDYITAHLDESFNRDRREADRQQPTLEAANADGPVFNVAAALRDP